MVVSLAVADLRVVRIDLLPNGPAGAEIERRPSYISEFTQGNALGIHGYVLVSVDSHHMVEDTALIVPGQVEIGVIGEVNDGILVCFRVYSSTSSPVSRRVYTTLTWRLPG